MSAGEYLNRQALEQIAPEYGLTSADIDLEIQYVKDKESGNFIEHLSFGGVAVEEPNKLTDKDVAALVLNGNKNVSFGVHATSVQRMLVRDELVKWLARKDEFGIEFTAQDAADLEEIGYTNEDLTKFRDAKYMYYLGYRSQARAESHERVKTLNDELRRKMVDEETAKLRERPIADFYVEGNEKINPENELRRVANQRVDNLLAGRTPFEYARDKNDEESFEKRLAGKSYTDYLSSGSKSLINSFFYHVGDTLKGVAVYANAASRYDELGNRLERKATDAPIYKLGEWTQQNVQAPNVDKDIERTLFGGTVPKTVGGFLPYLLGGWATAAPKATAAIFAGLSTGGSIYDEAKRSGATEAQAQKAALLTGGFVGVTSVVGYGKTLETLNGGAGAKTWQAIFREAIKDGGRNAVVAGGQTVFENGVARNIYDPKRGYLDNVRERMIAAGITGATLKGGLEIVAKVHAGANPKVLAETREVFRIEKSPLEVNAKQLEYRNSGIDLKAKLNEKLKITENKNIVTEKPASKIQSDANLRKELRDNLYEYKQYERDVKDLKMKYPEIKDIPTEDLVAIRAYTAEHYEWLNDVLRTGDKAGLERLRAHIICAISGLNQLPDFKGLVYRGTDLTIKQAEVYKKGEIVTEKDFKSTSYVKGAEFNGNTEFTIYSETGKKVDFLSKHPYEKEVMFRPRTKFLVLAVEIDSVTKIRNISLREVKGGK